MGKFPRFNPMCHNAGDLPVYSEFIQPMRDLLEYYLGLNNHFKMGDCPLCDAALKIQKAIPFDRRLTDSCEHCPWIALTGKTCDDNRHAEEHGAYYSRIERVPRWTKWRIYWLRRWIRYYERNAKPFFVKKEEENEGQT